MINCDVLGVIMDDIQNENVFVSNLKYHRPEWNHMIDRSKFYFRSTGSYSYYYDKKDYRQWGKFGLVVVVESDPETLEKWEKIKKEYPKGLESEFMGALSPDSDYEVVDERFNVTEPSSAFMMSDHLQDTINMIATRADVFTSRPIDEKLELLNDTIEFLLKRSGSFISINESDYFGLLLNENIKKFRKTTHIFRHASEQSIGERDEFSQKQKEFLVNYGTMIVITLSEDEE